MPDNLKNLIACHDCDLLIERIVLDSRQKALCPRCNSLLYQGRTKPLLKTLLVSLSGLIFVFPAYFLPLMTMSAVGLSSTTSLIASVPDLASPIYLLAGLSVFLFTILFPVLVLMSAFWVSVNLYFGHCPKHLAEVQKFYQRLQRWVMPEVYLLGAIVSYVKLLDNFSVELGLGIICFAMLMFCTLLVTATVSKQHTWEAIEKLTKLQNQQTASPDNEQIGVVRGT
jgi:paraquat-inducible protein A